MRRRAIYLALVPTAVLLLSLFGCGSGSSPIHETTFDARFSLADSRIDGQFFYDRYECRARRNGIATIELSSDEVDPYLEVYYRGGDLIVRNNDIDSTTHDAMVTFAVHTGEEFAIWAISNNENEQGRYTITFSKELGDIEEVEVQADSGARIEHPAPAESKTKFRIAE